MSRPDVTHHVWTEAQARSRGNSLVGQMPDPSKPDTDFVCAQCGRRVKGLGGYGVLPTHVMASGLDTDCDVETVRGIMES